jgi:hypothetical protein
MTLTIQTTNADEPTPEGGLKSMTWWILHWIYHSSQMYQESNIPKGTNLCATRLHLRGTKTYVQQNTKIFS